MITLKEEFVGGDKWKRAVALGGSDAIVLWLAMKRYAAEHLTDGFVPEEELSTLPGAPTKFKKALDALCKCGRVKADGSRSAGLVDPHPHGWQLHDYLDHANSAEQELERRRKERERKASYRAGRKADSGQTDDGCPTGTDEGTDSWTQPGTDDGTPNGTDTGVPAPPRASARVPSPAQPSPASRGEKPPTPKPRDPMGDQLRGKAPSQRPDVQRLHEAFKQTFGLSGHKLRAYGDENASWLAEAIDAHGEETCLRVLAHAPKDGMVSGRDDEQRVKHESIRYIFGNPDTFARILRAADEDQGQQGEGTVAKIRRLREADPGAA